MILSDSTLLRSGENHKSVHYMDGQPPGDIVGEWGGSFSTGSFEGVNKSIIAHNFSRVKTSGERLRVAYMLAGNSHPRHEFHEHHTAQSEAFGRTEWIATPTLNGLREQCVRDTGVDLFKSKGVHCTERGRLWLQKYLLSWADDKGVSLIYCVGWNSTTPATEYCMQVDLGASLQNSFS